MWFSTLRRISSIVLAMTSLAIIMNIPGCGTSPSIEIGPARIPTPLGPIETPPLRVTFPKQPSSRPPDILRDSPIGILRFRGCDWLLYNTDEPQGTCPRWAYCPSTKKLIPIDLDCSPFKAMPRGMPAPGSSWGYNPLLSIARAMNPVPYPEELYDAMEQALSKSYPSQYSFPPPEGLTAAELFEMFNVSLPDEHGLGEISSYFAWHVDIFQQSGMADVIFHLTTEHVLIPPELYEVSEAEVFIVQDIEGEPGYMSVRARGNLEAVLAWAVDMGIEEFEVLDEATGTGYHTIEIDQLTRALFMDGFKIGTVDPSPVGVN